MVNVACKAKACYQCHCELARLLNSLYLTFIDLFMNDYEGVFRLVYRAPPSVSQLLAMYARTGAETWKQSFQVCEDWSPQPQPTNLLPISRRDVSVWRVPRHMLIAVAPSVWVSYITLLFCLTQAPPLFPSFFFLVILSPLSQSTPVPPVVQLKKKKATVSLKPHSARQTVELAWKNLSHWVYFSSEWPGLLALG